jgi:hypothetical protein
MMQYQHGLNPIQGLEGLNSATARSIIYQPIQSKMQRLNSQVQMLTQGHAGTNMKPSAEI